jgi:hypothetical protein
MRLFKMFRKNAEFKVVSRVEKPGETVSQQEAKPVEAEKELLDAPQLEKLRKQWRGALEEAWETRFNPDVKLFRIKGARRLFYCVSSHSVPSGMEFEALDETLTPVKVTVQSNVTSMGPQIHCTCELFKTPPANLTPHRAALIAQTLIENFPQGGET